MKKEIIILPMMAMAMVLLTVSCGSKYPMYSPEELNLQSLTRITDNEDNKFDAPFGGDYGKELFFAVRDKKGNSNIYRKDLFFIIFVFRCINSRPGGTMDDGFRSNFLNLRNHIFLSNV